MDLARDHVVTEAVHDARQELKPIRPLIGDQNAKVMGPFHGSTPVDGSAQRAIEGAPRSPTSGRAWTCCCPRVPAETLPTIVEENSVAIDWRAAARSRGVS